MNKAFFDQNILALSKTDPQLCARLAFTAQPEVYHFMEARSGETIPAARTSGGAFQPLHSTVDPRREAERLIATLSGEGCLVFLGLGGAFAAEAALKRGATKKVLVVEYDAGGLAELLSGKSYTALFLDSRFRLLCDPQPAALESFIVNNYLPALDGGIRVFPLRARSDSEPRFAAAAAAVENAIENVSRDYSVQAYFGKRWFCNIVRNLFLAEKQNCTIPSIQHAIVCAAGPSLEDHIPAIQEHRHSYLIAVDTAFPALLHAGIEPDAVISIDCQYLSYHHFFGALPQKTRLFLDLASPPSVASRTQNRVFFSGGHPLSLYASHYWRPLPLVDTSGGNVTYAALSLAKTLGAKETFLFGADFSYPLGKTYARGTYLYPYFEHGQSRYSPIEAQHSAFLYRDSSLKKIDTKENNWYYETGILRFYRETVRRKEEAIKKAGLPDKHIVSLQEPGESATAFLKHYGASIEKLMFPCPAAEHKEEAELTATLLPLAAFFRRQNPSLNSQELFRSLVSFCLEELRNIKLV